MTDRESVAGDALLEGGAASCANLTPLIRTRLRELESGQVLEVVSAESTAQLDIESWCRLSGNPLVDMRAGDGATHFYIRKK